MKCIQFKTSSPQRASTKSVAVSLHLREVISDVGAVELLADLLIFCVTFQTCGVFIKFSHQD